MDILIEASKQKVEDKEIDLKQRTILDLDIRFKKDGQNYRLVESFIHTMFYEDEIDDLSKEIDVVYAPVSVVIDGTIDSKQKLIEIITNVCANLKIYVHSFQIDESFYVAYSRGEEKYLGKLEYSPATSENFLNVSIKAQLEDNVDYEKELDIRIKEPLEKISYNKLKEYGYEIDDYGVESFAILKEEDAERLVNHATTAREGWY